MASNIISSQWPSPPFQANSLSRLLFQSLSNSPQLTSIIDTYLDRRWTRGQVLHSALNFAQYLIQECHLKTGDIVFFATENSDIHAIALIGVLMAGGVYSCAPSHSVEREINELIALLKPKIFISNLAPKSRDLTIVSISLIQKVFENTEMDFSSLPVETDLDSLATLVLSSGSSGVPKAIKRTNRNILSTLAMFNHEEMMPFEEEDIILSTSFCHICGQRMVFSALASGSQLAIVRSDENHEEVFEVINKFKINSTVLIPTQLNWLVNNEYPREKLLSLTDVMTGAAPLSKQTHKSIETMFGFKKFRNSYGMSESGFALMVPLSGQIPSRATVGQVVPGFQIKVIDVNGNALEANHVGEICLKSEQVTQGYLNAEKESAKLFTSDGFLRSGDLGYYDEKKFFFIVGRIKEMIKCDGVSVSPIELENLLLRHKDVTNAAVIGVEDEERGHVPMAFVTLGEGAETNEEALCDWVNQRVNDFKKLRGGVRVIQQMPRTHSGKIRKTLLFDFIV